jgi:hypothetical protein
MCLAAFSGGSAVQVWGFASVGHHKSCGLRYGMGLCMACLKAKPVPGGSNRIVRQGLVHSCTGTWTRAWRRRACTSSSGHGAEEAFAEDSAAEGDAQGSFPCHGDCCRHCWYPRCFRRHCSRWSPGCLSFLIRWQPAFLGCGLCRKFDRDADREPFHHWPRSSGRSCRLAGRRFPWRAAETHTRPRCNTPDCSLALCIDSR